MDALIVLPFLLLSLGLSVLSLVTFFKSPGKIFIRLLKGGVLFFVSILSIGAFASGDYVAALIILAVIAGLTVRRYRLNKSYSPTKPASSPAPTEFKTAQSATTNDLKKSQGNYLKSKKPLEYIAFSYTDSNGSPTYREVDVKKVDDDYITGYCHTRRKLRTFRIDRVTDSEVVVRDSGEVLNVYDWIVLLYK